MRNLLRGLARSGRSVFVSSHLLSEMALMADQLVVIGRGRLIASGPTEDFIRTSRQSSVTVRTPQATELAELLRRGGVQVSPDGPGTLSVTGLDARAVGDLAFANSIRIHGLFDRVATLEEAFLEVTEAAQEFQAHQVTADSAAGQRR